MERKIMKKTLRSIKNRVAIILALTMMICDCVPAAAYALDNDVLISEDLGTSDATAGALEGADEVSSEQMVPDEEGNKSSNLLKEDAPVLEDGETLLSEEGILTESDDKTGKAETDVKESLQPEGSPEEEDAEELKADEPEITENEGSGAEGAEGEYDLNAVLLKAAQEYSYPGVYTVKLVSENASDKDFETIGIPSISNGTLESSPTNESPAIIMGAALPYEEKTGPTEYKQIPGGKLYAPYSYFRYEIIEEANLNGQGGTHKKMSGFDGTYMIIRVDVSDILKDAPDGSYLHVKQSNNKALMVKIGQESKNGCVTFADACGSKTGSYLISGNNLVTKDEDGAYQDVSYIDVIFLSSGTLVQGADTGGSASDPKAPLADFPLSFYIDKTEDYDPGIEWNSSLATAVNKETGKPITLTPEETNAGITTTDKLLAKYYDESKALGTTVRKYKVMGSDIELEEMVENTETAPTKTKKTEYWSLKKAMEYEDYNNHAIKLICEAPLLNSISVKAAPGISGRHVILDVNSFDIQLANHQETGAAALTVDNATLTIQDTFNTTGAELAVGNNAQMLVTNNGRLIITDTAQLEVEYDAASVSAGSVPKKKLVNGVITVNKGGVIENHGIITVEGREGKPQAPGTVVRDYNNARLTIDQGGTLENSGCALINGDLFNFGTIKNTGKYSEEITSNDPDKGTFTYHKGLQLSWKDDITQGETYSGELFNGVEYNDEGKPVVYRDARFINEGDFVMIPGLVDNYATITNSGNIYMCAVDEIVVPIMAFPDKPLVTEQRIKLGRFENSIFLNQNDAVIENSGTIGTAEIEIVSNGRTGNIVAEENRNKKEQIIDSYGKIRNSGKIAVGGLYAYNDVTNEGNGVVERVILAQNNDPLTTGVFTDTGSAKTSKIYNGAKGKDNVWRYAPIDTLKVSEATRIQEANPGETVEWAIGAESSSAGNNVTYSVRLCEPEPYREIGTYDVPAGKDVLITSEVVPDLSGNIVYEFKAEQAAQIRNNYTAKAAVKVKGTGFIKPTPVQDLVYNGKEQKLVTPGSMEGKNVLYRLGESGEYSNEIPGATDAGQYTVYYKVEGNDQLSGSMIAVIAKRDAYIAADNLVSKKGDAKKDLTYISNGIVSGDNIGISIICTELDMNTPGTYTITTDYLHTQGDKNYNVTTYNGTYTVLDTAVNISAQVQAVMVPFDKAGHNVSINLVYKPEISTNTSTTYYSLSENLTKENYKDKGTTVAPSYGSIGEQEIFYYVHTPEEADFSGSNHVVITKAEQKEPEKLTGEADFKGKGGTIMGLVPFNSERIPMEYRRADEDSYTRAVSNLAYVRAGSYLVRYAGDEHYLPSPDTLVPVSENSTASATFNSNGGTEVAPVTGLRYGDTVPEPIDPTKDGFSFDGWYTHEAFEFGEYDFSTIIEDPNNYNLYAKWKEIIPGTTEEETDEINTDVGKKDLLSVNEVVDPDETTVTTVKVSDNVISETKTTSDNKVTVKSGIWIGGMKDSYTYTGESIKPEIHVYDGVKKLVEKKDYTLSYKNNKEAVSKNSAKAPTITVKFKGNYKETEPVDVKFSIDPAELGKDVAALDMGIAAKRKDAAQKPVPTIVWNNSGKTVNSKSFTFTYKKSGEEAPVPAITTAGEYTVEITPKDSNFNGTMSSNITVTGTDGKLLSKVSVKFNPSSYVYTGKAIVPADNTIKLKDGNKELKLGEDYEITKVYNNIEPGKATVVFSAITKDGGYTGTKTATFTISKGREITNVTGSSFVFTYPKKVSYIKSGAKPVLKVFDSTVLLKEGVDYTVSYKDNKKAGNTAKVIVKGKAKYKGSAEFKFEITKQDIGELTVTAADQFVTKDKYKNPKITVIDSEGKKLGTKDYKVVSDNVVPATDEIIREVVIEGTGNYTGTAIATFRLMDKTADISKAKSFKIPDQEYTGQPVTLSGNDLRNIIYAGKKDAPVYLTQNKDFEVVGYTDNIKNGTAKVTVRGIGKWAGTNTLRFSIKQKKGSYLGVLINGIFEK